MNDVAQQNGAAAEGTAHGVVIMKFGGTSVENAAAIRRLVSIVKSRLGSRPLVVVSALAKVTDQLLTVGNSAARGHLELASTNLLALRRRHEEVARDLVSDEEHSRLQLALDNDFLALSELVRDLASSGQLSPRAQDHLVGFGECLSSKIVASALAGAGIAAALISHRQSIVTDTRYTRANPLISETYKRVNQFLKPLVEAGCVPVLGGFVASTRDGVPTTLGRGGSDFSAAIFGAALKASRIEIWTDVDGIMTSDPNICADARLIRRMSFDEAAELAHFGAKVLHPATLLPAMRENIPVYVLNSRKPGGGGTEILAQGSRSGSVRAVTVKRGVAAVEVDAREHVDRDLLNAIYAALDRHHCPVDVMTASRTRVSLLVGSRAALAAVAADLDGLATVRWENHQALICLVGENIRRQPDVVSRVFAAVSDMDVRVCQGASDRTISFLVDESKAVESVQRLHAMFFPLEAPSLERASTTASSRASKDSHALCQAGDTWL